MEKRPAGEVSKGFGPSGAGPEEEEEEVSADPVQRNSTSWRGTKTTA
jgi:hypothetical protein